MEAVVQLRSKVGAAQALALHGRYVYEHACLLDIQDVSPEYNLHLCSLLEQKQTATVAEYTASFWECVQRVLDITPNLSIKCFVHQYVQGLRTDIQAAVQSQTPSSITRASCLARIREEEIMQDEAICAGECGDGYGDGVQDNSMMRANLLLRHRPGAVQSARVATPPSTSSPSLPPLPCATRPSTSRLSMSLHQHPPSARHVIWPMVVLMKNS